MGNHYFDNQPLSPSNRKEISFRFFGTHYTLESDTGVFSKDGLDTGTRILLETIVKENLTNRILDYGCGIGIIGLMLKLHFQDCDVSGFDVNQRAVDCANKNAKRLNCDVNFYVANQIIDDQKYDVIVMNPPIRSGKQNIYRMFQDSYTHLNKQGKLYIVIRKSHGAPSAIKELQQYFRTVEILKRDKGFNILQCIK